MKHALTTVAADIAFTIICIVVGTHRAVKPMLAQMRKRLAHACHQRV